jgi:hypothetical protein
MKKYIIVTLQIPGLHYWKEATGTVSYLGLIHRHVFYITCKKEVTKNNREIEIIQFKETILDDLKIRFYTTLKDICDFGVMSCEDIAEMLIRKHELNYCSVLEDNENGAEITNI